MSEHDDFANFMRRKYFTRDGELIDYYVKSSIWSGIKWAYSEVKSRSQWVIGNGCHVDIWRGNWLAPLSVKDALALDSQAMSKPVYFEIPAPDSSEEDKLMWIPDPKGTFSVKSAIQEIRKKGSNVAWHNLIWKSGVQASTAAIAWKLCQNCAAVDSNLMKRAVKAFESMKLPWWMKMRWTSCRQKLLSSLLTSTWRKVNFAADQAAKKATSESDDLMHFCKGK
ncbi:hypothetical protein FRX31_015844 [Thalictrum thalictroides]|uniref:Reverse transcriptase zinc-binding domain-containing protein n=1 Tax=Thalictrum thalictroides TaxID=46969 RepID=A0A7J6WCH8_THATH|nr:hypothetical protein FRX31_015844 [Thalictrum thalictroides]